MDPDPHPLLLEDDVRGAAVDRPRRPEYRVPVLEEALQVGVVTPRMRYVSVHRTRSTLASLMPCL